MGLRHFCGKNSLSVGFIAFLTICLFSFLGYANGFKETPSNNESFLKHIKTLYSELGFSEEILSFEALQCSLTAYYIALRENLIKRPNLLTIIDYTKPCNKERFLTIDLRDKKIVLKELVSHGKKSGSRYVRSFSNKPGSLKSSIGLYITLEAYWGGNGYSLRLRGLERGYNDNAQRRNIVIHGARYVNKKRASNSGCIGTSWGCPVVPLGSAKKVIDTIKNGSALFIYYPLKRYLQKSEYINLAKAARVFNQSNLNLSDVYDNSVTNQTMRGLYDCDYELTIKASYSRASEDPKKAKKTLSKKDSILSGAIYLETWKDKDNIAIFLGVVSIILFVLVISCFTQPKIVMKFRKANVSSALKEEQARNGRQKMKLKTSYWKNTDGSIKVAIKVMDKGDFPTINIFRSNSGYPADEGWNLREGTADSISNTLPNSDEVKQWALTQINAVKKKLDNWRNILVPEPEEFEI